jgi:cystathionine beta-lyase
MSFDEIIDRAGSHCTKWDMMESYFNVAPDTGLAMWVADMDFRPPAGVQTALQAMLDHGVYGYFGDDRAYRAAIVWWMASRHGWDLDPEAIFSTHGLVNGTALCIDAWSKPGDGVVLMTPVYHAFHRIIAAAGREIVQCRLTNIDNRYELDIDAWDAQMKGHERLFILCSPHNPGGRVWSRAELQAIAAFCKRHDLILVSTRSTTIW